MIKDDKNINVKCKLCHGGTKTLSTPKNTTSNLLETDPSKGEQSAATDDGLSLTLLKQQKQDFSATISQLFFSSACNLH